MLTDVCLESVTQLKLMMVFERFKKASRRRQIGVPAFLVVVGISIWAIKERGALDGVTLLVGSFGLLLGLLQMIPSRPKLRLTGQDDDSVLTVTPTVRPVDEDSIVKERVSQALEAMPRRPPPEDSTPNALDWESPGLGPGNFGIRHSDETLRKHEAKIFDYESELREWVTTLEAARADRLRLFEKELRLHELGQALADHVHLRLFFPEGFELEDEAPDIGAPPEPPELLSDRREWLRQLAETLPVKPGSIKLHHPGDEPHYSTRNSLPVVDYELGRINQSDHRDVPAFELKAPREPGNYEIRWEASAAGLTKPAQGVITLRVQEPLETEPITTMEEANEERLAFLLF